MDMSQVVKDLQDAVIVLSKLERRQSVALGEHREWLQEHDRSIAEIRQVQRESVGFELRIQGVERCLRRVKPGERRKPGRA